MKILMIISYFAERWGGDVYVCSKMSKYLEKHGNKVTIITTDFGLDPQYVHKIQEEGVEVITFPTILRSGFFIIAPSMADWLDKNIRDFDVIHLHNSRSYQNILVYKYLQKYRVPYVLQAHGNVLSHSGKMLLKFCYDTIWGNKILKGASKVIALTETEKKNYLNAGLGENKIEIIPNGIDLDEYTILPNKGVFRETYGIRDSTNLILYVGRVHHSKGIDLLIDAIADVVKQTEDIKLVLIGPDQGYASELTKKIFRLQLEEKVLLLGFVDSNSKKSAFIDADVFVTPRFSGLPITFIESCACGTPIITTNVGDDLPWLHNNVGYIVDYNKDDVSRAIIHLISNENTKRGFGHRGVELVREQLNWDMIVSRLEGLYRTIITPNN